MHLFSICTLLFPPSPWPSTGPLLPLLSWWSQSSPRRHRLSSLQLMPTLWTASASTCFTSWPLRWDGMKMFVCGCCCLFAFFFQGHFIWNVLLSLCCAAALTRKLYDWPGCRWLCGCSPSPVGWATVSAAAFGRDSTSATCTLYGKKKTKNTLYAFLYAFPVHFTFVFPCCCFLLLSLYFDYRFHNLIINQTRPCTWLRIWTVAHKTHSVCPLLPPGLLAAGLTLSDNIVIS